MGGRSWAARLVAVALLGLVAGCELRTTVEVELGDDGGGRLAVTVEADEELAARAAEQPVDPLDELAEVGRALEPDWGTETGPTQEGGRAVTLAARFDDPDELERLSAELSAALAAPELDPLDRFTVAVDRDRLRLSGRAGLEPTEEVADLGLEPAAAVAQLEDTVDYRVRVLPAGEVLETTADEREDGALTWRVPAGGSVEILAVAARPQRPWGRLGAGAAAIALAGGLAAWWWFRRRGGAPAGRGAGSTSGAA